LDHPVHLIIEGKNHNFKESPKEVVDATSIDQPKFQTNKKSHGQT
jgi:hypothetical protein